MGKFTRIAADLVSLEINTIEKDNMTAQKMPSVPHALLDVSINYLRKMVSVGLDPTHYWGTDKDKKVELLEIPKPDDRQKRGVKVWTREPPPFDNSVIRNGHKDFGHLRWLARGLAINPEFKKRPEKDRDIEEQLLERITRNCDEIREIVRWLMEESKDKDRWGKYLGKSRRDVIRAIKNDGPPPPLDVADATRIRKIWELGTERVVLQTIIQVDGDVITRVRPDLRSREADLLFEIHRHGIKTSVESWRFLLDIVGKLAGKAVETFFGSRS